MSTEHGVRSGGSASATMGAPRPRSALVLAPTFLRNPLAAKELRGRMRGPRPFVVAVLYLLPLGALAVGLYAIITASTVGNVAGGVPVGKLFFAAISALELGLICLLAPALTADLISGERERRTYELLLVTPLSPLQIVVGKLVPALGSLLLLVVLALPLQAIAILLGGVGPEELLLGFAILVLTAMSSGCVGLYWSARLRGTRAAVACAYGSTVLGVIGLPLAAAVTLVGGNLVGVAPEWTWFGLGDRAGALQVQLLAWLGPLLGATYAPLRGVFSAVALAQGHELLFVERVAGHDVTLVALAAVRRRPPGRHRPADPADHSGLRRA